MEGLIIRYTYCNIIVLLTCLSQYKMFINKFFVRMAVFPIFAEAISFSQTQTPTKKENKLSFFGDSVKPLPASDMFQFGITQEPSIDRQAAPVATQKSETHPETLNAYQILGLSGPESGASRSDINAAYRLAWMQGKYDKGMLNNALIILSDPATRAQLDAKLMMPKLPAQMAPQSYKFEKLESQPLPADFKFGAESDLDLSKLSLDAPKMKSNFDLGNKLESQPENFFASPAGDNAYEYGPIRNTRRAK